jgi:hypothetical protein
LFTSLREKHIQNGLHLAIVVKQVVVADLRDLVDSGLLGHVLGSLWLGDEVVGLSLDVLFLGLLTALFGQEVGQVDFDAGRGTWSEVIRVLLLLLLFEFNELVLDHLDLFALALGLDASLFLLRGR